jgi:Tol biopolymer transport system component
MFTSQAPQDTHAQIYVWDGKTATNMSQNPDHHNGSPRWRSDGYWAFSTFFSSEQKVYVRDADNQTVLAADGQSPHTWSSDGDLIFCRNSSAGWDLMLWDGEEIIQVTQGGEILAQWMNGGSVVCSSG